MTTKIIRGTYSSGYNLTAPTTVLSITATGYIDGGGVYAKSGGAYTVINNGKIVNPGGARITAQGSTYAGVRINGQGFVTNGCLGNTHALIQGSQFGSGVVIGAGAVRNFGTILGSKYAFNGVQVQGDGSVVNGSAVDTTALIMGARAVSFRETATSTKGVSVTNFGRIIGTGQLLTSSDGRTVPAAGVYLGAGTVTNGSAKDNLASIQGYDGVYCAAFHAGGFASTVTNYGTIVTTQGSVTEVGVGLGAGGKVLNASLNARIAGVQGVVVRGGTGAVVNRGTIEGTGSTNTSGVSLAAGGAVINGSASNRTALISGNIGVVLSGAGVVTNFGTLLGVNGVAVMLSTADETLILEPGSVTRGSVQAGAGTIDLVAGFNSLAGLSTSGRVVGAGALVLSGGASTLGAGANIAATAVIVSAGAMLTSLGDTVVKSPIVNAGTLSTNAGTLTVLGQVTGAGVLRITAGTANFASTFSESVAFLGVSGTLELAQSQAYAGALGGFSKTGKTSLDLVDIAFTSSTKASYAGSAASGVLTVKDAAHTAQIKLSGDYTHVKFVLAADGHGGTTIVGEQSPAAAAFSAAMACLQGDFAGASVANLGVCRGETQMLARPKVALA